MNCRSAVLALAMLMPACPGVGHTQSLSTMPAGPTDSSFTPQQRREVIDIIRSALRADPSILRDAIAALQAEEGAKAEAATQAAITSLSSALTKDAGDPIAGNPNGDVTVVEFYDLRCPYCRSMQPLMSDLLKKDRNIRIVFKDIPILGPGSLLGARAVLAAQRQGGYLKLRDLLMAGTPNIDLDVVRIAARRAGLDWDRLQEDMADPAIQARIDANLKLAHALQVQGTPVYVIGTHMLPGAVELAQLQGAVAAARRK